MYKINEISKISGVTVRTLHHYDKIGLLVPSERNDSNYRLYNENDVSRLYQILIYKELELSLKDIKDILDKHNVNKEEILKSQKKMIIEKRDRLNQIIISIDETIENKGVCIMSKDKFKVFSYEDVKKHEEEYKKEVDEKYNESNAYNQSKSKTSKYSKNDWETITEEANNIYIKLSKLMDKEIDDEDVQKLVHEWREHISKYYYDCTIEMFRGLALMYVGDERFTKNIDKFGEGLAQFLSDAMNEYCDIYK